MKVCFIGSNGFLARTFGKFYESKNVKVSVWGKGYPQYKYAEFFQFDLENEGLDVTKLINYDVIFYFAGKGIQSNDTSSASTIFQINTFVPIRILIQLKELQYKGNFITFGSYSEIGNTPEARQFTEIELITSTNSVPNDYVLSKRLLTSYIQSVFLPFKYHHFILPTIYGVGENKNRIIPYVIECIKNESPINITAGSQLREYLSVREVPLIVDIALNKDIPSGIYNMEGSEKWIIKELVKTIIEKYNYPQSQVNFGIAKRWDISMKSLLLDGTKLYSTINYHPIQKLEQIMHEYWT